MAPPTAQGRELFVDEEPDAPEPARGLVAHATTSHLHSTLLFATLYIGACTAGASDHPPCAHTHPLGLLAAACAFGTLVAAHLIGSAAVLVVGEVLLALVACLAAPGADALARCAWDATPPEAANAAALALTLASWNGLVMVGACVVAETLLSGQWPMQRLRRDADIAVMRQRAAEPTALPGLRVMLRVLPSVLHQLLLVPAAALMVAFAAGAAIVLQQGAGPAARAWAGAILAT